MKRQLPHSVVFIEWHTKYTRGPVHPLSLLGGGCGGMCVCGGGRGMTKIYMKYEKKDGEDRKVYISFFNKWK